MNSGVLIAILIGCSLGLGFLAGGGYLTGNVVDNFSDHYSYTTAICDLEDLCVDVLVECGDGQVIRLKLASNGVDFSNYSTLDLPREKRNLCNGKN